MKKTIIILCFLFSSLIYQAQIKSLLSANGEGRLMSPVFSLNKFSGELSAAIPGLMVNNFQNPASYADATLTAIEVGALGQFGSFDYKDSLKPSGGVALSHISFLMPMTAGKSGLNLGFYRKANTNYGIDSLGIDPVFGKFQKNRSGEGNLYNAFVGMGFRFGKVKLGGNLIGQIGQTNFDRDIKFPDSLRIPTIRERSSVSQFNLLFQLGTQYDIEISKTKQLILGGYFNGSLSNSGNKELSNQTIYTTASGIVESISSVDTNFDINLPSSSKFGLGVSYITNKSLLLGIEYNMEDFSSFRDVYGAPLQKAWHFHLGMEYKPYLNRTLNSRKFLNKATYRMGTVFGKSEQNFNSSLNDFKLLGSLTSPIFGRNIGYVTLGLEYANRGFSGNTGITENSMSIHLILTFADKWFIRQKFD